MIEWKSWKEKNFVSRLENQERREVFRKRTKSACPKRMDHRCGKWNDWQALKMLMGLHTLAPKISPKICSKSPTTFQLCHSFCRIYSASLDCCEILFYIENRSNEKTERTTLFCHSNLLVLTSLYNYFELFNHRYHFGHFQNGHCKYKGTLKCWHCPIA